MCLVGLCSASAVAFAEAAAESHNHLLTDLSSVNIRMEVQPSGEVQLEENEQHPVDTNPQGDIQVQSSATHSQNQVQTEKQTQSQTQSQSFDSELGVNLAPPPPEDVHFSGFDPNVYNTNQYGNDKDHKENHLWEDIQEQGDEKNSLDHFTSHIKLQDKQETESLRTERPSGRNSLNGRNANSHRSVAAFEEKSSPLRPTPGVILHGYGSDGKIKVGSKADSSKSAKNRPDSAKSDSSSAVDTTSDTVTKVKAGGESDAQGSTESSDAEAQGTKNVNVTEEKDDKTVVTDKEKPQGGDKPKGAKAMEKTKSTDSAVKGDTSTEKQKGTDGTDKAQGDTTTEKTTADDTDTPSETDSKEKDPTEGVTFGFSKVTTKVENGVEKAADEEDEEDENDGKKTKTDSPNNENGGTTTTTDTTQNTDSDSNTASTKQTKGPDAYLAKLNELAEDEVFSAKIGNFTVWETKTRLTTVMLMAEKAEMDAGEDVTGVTGESFIFGGRKSGDGYSRGGYGAYK